MRYSRVLGVTLVLAAAMFAAGCSSKPKYPACGGDKDCKDGEHCVNKQCLQCGQDSDCPDGQECVEGGCKLKKKAEKPKDDGLKSCKVDEDCADDEDCIDGKCRKPWESKPPEGVDCQLATVYFDFDQDGISPEYRQALEKDAECIKSAPDTKGVYLTGHTDPRGTEEYNIALSERRARAVADFLANLGIDPARMQVVPKGETESSGVDEESWQQDRRVDLEWK